VIRERLVLIVGVLVHVPVPGSYVQPGLDLVFEPQIDIVVIVHSGGVIIILAVYEAPCGAEFLTEILLNVYADGGVVIHLPARGARDLYSPCHGQGEERGGERAIIN